MIRYHVRVPGRKQGGYRIEYTHEADDDLRYLGRMVDSAVRKAVPRFLADQPMLGPGRRKKLDPNPLEAGWRLKVGDYRVLYDVHEEARVVRVLRVGYKPAETLYLRGQPIQMRVD